MFVGRYTFIKAMKVSSLNETSVAASSAATAKFGEYRFCMSMVLGILFQEALSTLIVAMQVCLKLVLEHFMV